MRRGGAQFLARSGVEVWRIQALARHSSSAILAYIADSHVASLGSIAAEAASGRSLEAVRQELAALQKLVLDGKAQAASLQEFTAPGSTGIQIPISTEQALAPEPPPPPRAATSYILSHRRYGKLHIATRSRRA